MKCIILAAGYATRLYPLTEDFPKPLLPVQGRSILEWLLADIENVSQIDEVIVVSNHKFYRKFLEWRETLNTGLTVTIIDDGSTANDNRLGAVRDIAFAIESCAVKEDILVMAGDNLLDFSIKGFVDFFEEKKSTCIMRHYESSMEKLRRTGVASIDESGRVLQMEEKPQNPQSHWAVPPFYIYTSSDLKYIHRGIASGVCGTDAPGSFIEWLCGETTVYAYPMSGQRYDIGDLNSYNKIQEGFLQHRN